MTVLLEQLIDLDYTVDFVVSRNDLKYFMFRFLLAIVPLTQPGGTARPQEPQVRQERRERRLPRDAGDREDPPRRLHRHRGRQKQAEDLLHHVQRPHRRPPPVRRRGAPRQEVEVLLLLFDPDHERGGGFLPIDRRDSDLLFQLIAMLDRILRHSRRYRSLAHPAE